MKSKLSVILFILAFSLSLLAQQRTVNVDTKMDGGKKMIKVTKCVDDALNLTDEQKKEFKKLDLQFEKETLAKRNEIGVKKLELDVELDEDNPDLKAVNSLIDSIHKLEADIEKSKIAIHLKKRDLLTDEQKKSWNNKPQKIDKKIIMLKGDNPQKLQRFGNFDEMTDLPIEIEEEIEIY